MTTKTIPYTYTTEYKNVAHGHQAQFGTRLNRKADLDAYFADQPNCKYWENQANEAMVRLVAKFGHAPVMEWLNVLPEKNTIKQDYEAMCLVLNCQHEHTEGETRGYMHFAGGEIWDSFQTVTACLDCLMTWPDKPASEEIPFGGE